ncbi:hypothetical protein C0991_009652 [Blastosporella zonata]|nr:hypothetical protein C0991_009652 [Blastosporella zonata]
MTARGSSRANPGGPMNLGVLQRSPPIRHNPLLAIVGDTGPIRSTSDAHQYLGTNGWVLAAESYNRNKIAQIITSVTLGGASYPRVASNALRPEVRNTLLATFLIDEDITDSIADTIAELVASKPLARLEPILTSLATLASFAAASDTSRADNTLTLQNITDKLTSSIDTLSNTQLPERIPLNPPPPLHSPPPSWAAMVSTNIPTSTTFNPKVSDRYTRLQQWIIKDSRIITFEFLTNDPSTPQDHSPSGLANLRTIINDTLKTIDKEEHLNFETIIRGIREVSRPESDKTNLIPELDSPESAKQITKYTSSILHTFLTDILGNTAKISTCPHNVIIRFVPCDRIFDPTSDDHI